MESAGIYGASRERNAIHGAGQLAVMLIEIGMQVVRKQQWSKQISYGRSKKSTHRHTSIATPNAYK